MRNQEAYRYTRCRPPPTRWTPIRMLARAGPTMVAEDAFATAYSEGAAMSEAQALVEALEAPGGA